MPRDQGVFARAWADLKQATTHWWRFRIPAAALTAAFAAVAAIVANHATPPQQVVLAVSGTVGGALLLGVVAFGFLVATTPTRQRNEARAELRQLTAAGNTDPDSVAEEFGAWLRQRRAALPDEPRTGGFGLSILYDRELQAKRNVEHAGVWARYQERWSEVERGAREEYQTRFRERVLRVLGESHAEAASDPHTISDFEGIGALLDSRRGDQ